MSLLLLLGGGGPGGPVASYADVTIGIAFGHTWQDPSPVFVDVTEHVEFNPGFKVRRGRSRELDTFQAGSANWTLRNDDRLFDPLYEDGTHFGQLEDMVPCRIQATYSGATYDIFRGFVEAWPQGYTTGDNVALVDVTAVDAFAILAQTSSATGAFTLDDVDLGVLDDDRLAGGGGTVELSGARIDALLDVAGWPSSFRDLADGATVCQEQDVDDEMLAAIQLVEVSEDGFFYVEANGDFTFHGRHDRQTVARLADVQATFSDNGDMPYDDLVILPKDVELVANDVRRQREGGVEQSAIDGASIGKRGRRTHSRTGLVMDTDEAAADLAWAHLNRYAEPGTRIDALVISPGNNPVDMWPEVLGRRILDRIQVERTPQQVGDPIVLEVLIQGIEHSYSDFRWQTRFYVTPADSTQFFVLDDADLGVLDDDLIGA